MRLDPKHFNLFIGVCAALTVLIIFYSTIRYSQNQISDFEKIAEEYPYEEVVLRSFAGEDSLYLERLMLNESPVILHFWSTWSEKSLEVNRFLADYITSNPSLTVVAAAVRDSDKQIEDYIAGRGDRFLFAEGTDFYQSLKVPGMPSQLLFRPDGSLYSLHVGDQLNTLKQELDNLMQDGQ